MMHLPGRFRSICYGSWRSTYSGRSSAAGAAARRRLTHLQHQVARLIVLVVDPAPCHGGEDVERNLRTQARSELKADHNNGPSHNGCINGTATSIGRDLTIPESSTTLKQE